MGYDSTYVLAVSQKFAIPEKVINGDYVDFWKKTYTWHSSGSISYSIEKNYNNAFSIHAGTGLITVTDASKINGKIVRQDTVINVIIRTTDSELGYELDTAKIWIKENAYCKFINYSYSGSGTGTREQPFNSLDAVKFNVGYGYFLLRGASISNRVTVINSHKATSDHPTIIGAYGKGEKPKFVGLGASGGNSECFYLGTSSGDPYEERAENVLFYSIVVRNYGGSAFKANRLTKNIGWYNCETHNNSINTKGPFFTLNDQTYADSTTKLPFEFINLESDSSAGSHIKAGTGPCIIINSHFKGTDGVRFAAGNNGMLKHSYIETEKGEHLAVQVRGDNTIIEDVIISKCGYGIDLTSPGYKSVTIPFIHMPDNCIIKNVSILDYEKYAVGIWKPDEENIVPRNNIIEDCYIKGSGTRGIRINSGNGIAIRRNMIFNSGEYGIYIQGNYPIKNIALNCNIICGGVKGEIAINNGSALFLYNNTVDGIIDLSGAVNTTVRNNFFKSITNASTASNNLIIAPDMVTTYFQDYSKHDYRLKSSAVNAINKGYPVGLNYDYSGKSINGIPDIGAYEFASIEPGNLPVFNNSPVINDQSFVLYPQDLKDSYVGQIIAYDNDADQILTYSIISGNGTGIFIMDGKTGKLSITTADVFDAEVSNYELQVRIDDNGVQSKNSTAIVKITFIAHSNNVYINPLNASDPMENGSYDHPFDSWQDVKWQEGNAYLQKRGTIASEEKIFIGADNITLGAYDEGELPVIESKVNSYVISGFDKKNITISYLNIKGINAVSCIYFLGGNTDNITIEHCALDGNANSIRVVDGMRFIIKYNTISSENEGIYSMANSIEAYYNIFKNNSVAINVAGNSSKANIFNNVFIDNIESVSSNYAELTLYNNIFYLSAPNHIAIKQGSNQISSDHNIFFPDQQGFIEIAGKTYDDLKHIQQGLNMDLHSFNSDPLFSDLRKGDFTIKRHSPAINSGINLNLDEDLAGEKVPYANLPDIGVFEFKGVLNDNQSQANEGKSTLLIYPNPSTGLVNVDIRFNEPTTDLNGESVNNPLRSELKVVNMSGKIVFSKLMESTESVLMENLDLTGVSNGLYNVVLQTANKILSEKLIINK